MKTDDPTAKPESTNLPSSQSTVRQSRLVIAIALGLATVWTAVVGISLVWDARHNNHTVLDLARVAARAVIEKDIVYRHWAAENGGIYVPVSDEVRPSLLLTNTSERDVTTPSGRVLTLINPAQMTRLVHELENRQFGARPHLTSLNPLRVENAGDAWETNALRAFARGEKEYYTVERSNGADRLRLMLPLVTERSCLKCHEAQGYKEGDIRGGLGVSLSLKPYDVIAHEHQRAGVIAHAAIWLVGLLGLAGSFCVLNRRAKERNVAMARLQVVQKELEDFYEHAPDLFLSVDATGTIASCNVALAEKVGKLRRDLVGRPVSEIFHHDSIDALHAALERFREAGEIRNIELKLQGRTGRPIDVEISATAIRDQAGNILRSRTVLRDITEQNQMQQALRESEERYRLLFKSNPHPMWVYDIETLAFVAVNDAAIRKYGYSKEEFLGMTIANIRPPEDVPLLLKTVANLSDGLHDSGTWRHRLKDGRIIVVEIISHTLLFDGRKAEVVLAHDVTERNGAQAALAAERNLLRVVTDNVPDFIYAKDAQGAYLFANATHLRLFGAKSVDEIVGRTVFDFLPPEVAERAHGDDESIVHGRKPLIDREESLVDEQGTVRWLHTTKMPLRDAAGHVTGIVGISRDITQQKTAAMELRDNEQRFRSLFENATIGIYRTTPDGRILLANPALVRMLGFGSFEQLAQRNLEEQGYEPRYSRGQFRERIEREGAIMGLESAWIRADGSTVFVRESVTAVRDSQRKVLYYEGTVENMTDRKRAEEALRQSEQQYRALFDEGTEGIAVADFETGVVLDCNKALLEMIGREKNEVVGQSQKVLHPPVEDGNAVTPAFASHREERKGELIEMPLLTKSGMIKTVEVKARVLEINGRKVLQGFFRDLTQRREAEAALRASEESYRMLFEGITDGVFVHGITKDNLPGAFLAVNNVICERLGYTREELLRMTVLDIDAPESTVDRQAVIRKLRRNEKVLFEQTHVTKNGRRIPVEIHVQAFHLQNRPVVLSVIRDVTERKRSEEERARLEAQLRQAQKMEAVGQLAGGVAHDFNNILTIILGNAGLLGSDTAVNAQAREQAQQIADAAKRAASLTRQLLAFSRQQVMQVQPLNLNEVLGQILKMLQRVLGEHIVLQCNYGPELPPVEADVGMLEQVIMNLAVNARDAMARGGRLIVSTDVRNIGPDHARRNREAREGSFVILTIADTGCGMDDATLARIFEPFFTTKEVGKGTGLGLATAYGIIKQHNGWIEVESRINRGTTFSVFLPAGTKPGIADKSIAPVEHLVGGNETILVVEDEALVRVLVKKCLEKLGYTVIEAGSGVQALRVWDECRRPVDLLLTDMVMPEGMNGRELAQQLRVRKPDLRIIYSSGYSREILEPGMEFLPGELYLPKPYNPVALAQTVRRCLDGG